MNDRYMVISPDTLEAMRRAGHAAKLEARIEKLEAALREIDEWAEEQCYVGLRKLIRKALEGKNDIAD